MSTDLVKSAARAMEILEIFAERREPLTSAQLGAALGYPKSSLSVLIKSMLAQGYLTMVGEDGHFLPTMKVARLGDWIPSVLLGSESFIPVLEALRDKTGETVTLTMASGLNMRVLHALLGTHPISLRVEEGLDFPMIGTAIGAAYLSTQPDKIVERKLSAWSAHLSPAARKSVGDVMGQIAEAREKGYATAYDAVIADTGAIAMPVMRTNDSEPLVIAVAGLNLRIRRKEQSIIKAMQKTVLHGSGAQ